MTATLQSNRGTRTDWGLVAVVFALLVMGLMMVYSASYHFPLFRKQNAEQPQNYFLRRQIIFAALGVVALVVCSRIDYHLYERFAIPIAVLTVGTLLLMAILGRWLLTDQNQRSVQPSELAKVGAIIYIAVWLAARGERIRTVTFGLIPFSLLLGVIAGLIVAQPNFSTAVLFAATATAMFFAAGADMKQMVILLAVGGLALYGVAMAQEYRKVRIGLWRTSPFSDASGQGFQVVQALAALTKGRLFGVGLGQSQQKFGIYAPHTDGMFAIIAEEWGFVGAVVVLTLYALYVWRGLVIARQANDVYGKLLAVGLVSWVMFQASLHVAVITHTTPFTGTLLPFVSYGGSSMLSGLASVGVLLNVARHTREAQEQDTR